MKILLEEKYMHLAFIFNNNEVAKFTQLVQDFNAENIGFGHNRKDAVQNVSV